MQASNLPSWHRSTPRRCRTALAGGLAASSLVLAWPAQAEVTLVNRFTQATYDVDVLPGSDLLGFSGFSGGQVTSYASPAGVTGTGVILQSFPGQFVTLTQHLKLHFQARAGYTFDSVDFSHLLSYFNDRGGFRARMSWVLDPEDGAAQSGSTPLYEDFGWFHGGSFNDPTQPSPLLTVNDDAFGLDVTLFYASTGFSGGCFTGSGVCQQISANSVKIWARTALAPDTPDDPPAGVVPEPALPALLLTGLGLLGLQGRFSRRPPAAA
jgi:hypothetical protein